MVSIEALRHQLDYTAWASARLVEAAAQLTNEELTRDFNTADRSVIGTLAHVFGADRLWLALLQQTPLPSRVTEKDRNLAILQTEWPALHDAWKEWLGGLDQRAPETNFSYSDSKGNRWNQPLWQLILHVVNHGTHHRGQVAGFIRALGKSPPPLDLVAYYRQINT